MQLAALMPVGPGEADRHLERCLRSAREWADLLLVYGDGPDDATRRLIMRYAHLARLADHNEYEQGEHLVRNHLFEMADTVLSPGDMVAALDADEELPDPAAARATLAALEHDPRESFNVHFLHLWNPEGTAHRVDGLWQPSVGPRVYRHQPGYRLRPLYESAWVCPPLPPHLLREASPPILDVLHWSYARPQDRAPKHDRYMRLPGHHPAHIASILTEPTLEPVTCR